MTPQTHDDFVLEDVPSVELDDALYVLDDNLHLSAKEFLAMVSWSGETIDLKKTTASEVLAWL